MFDIGRQKKWLGISVGERALFVAEVSCAVAGECVGRAAEFAYPNELSLEQPDELGNSLRQFLQERGYSARSAVLGVPAKWLMLRPHSVPPADPATAAQILWLHTSARITPELGPMVFDFAGQASATQPMVVMLVGLQRHRIDRLQALGRAAGLRVISITSCGASLAAASAANAEDDLILLLRSDGVELITQEHGEVRAVRHVGPVGATRPLIAELRRTAAAMPGNPGAATEGQSGSEDSRPSLVVWDDVGADPQYLEAARQAVGGPLVKPLPQWIGLSDFYPPDGKGLSAVALTLAARNRSPAAVDFLHPRLAPPVQPARPRALWVTAAAVIVLLILGAVIGAVLALSAAQHTRADRRHALAERYERVLLCYLALLDRPERGLCKRDYHIDFMAGLFLRDSPTARSFERDASRDRKSDVIVCVSDEVAPLQ